MTSFNSYILHITHKEVLKMIQQGETGWEKKVPPRVAQLIRKKRLFGYMPGPVEAS